MTTILGKKIFSQVDIEIFLNFFSMYMNLKTRIPHKGHGVTKQKVFGVTFVYII